MTLEPVDNCETRTKDLKIGKKTMQFRLNNYKNTKMTEHVIVLVKNKKNYAI